MVGSYAWVEMWSDDFVTVSFRRISSWSAAQSFRCAQARLRGHQKWRSRATEAFQLSGIGLRSYQPGREPAARQRCGEFVAGQWPAQHFGNSGFRQRIDIDLDRGRRREQYRLPRSQLKKSARKIQAVLNVRAATNQNDIESIGFGTPRCKRIAGAFETNGLVSKRRQFFLVRQQMFSLTFDEQHRLAAPKRKQRRLCRRGAVASSSRQPHLKTASLPRLALRAYGSIVITDDFANGCQTEAGSGKARGEKRLEQSLRNSLIEAPPIVSDGNADVPSGREVAGADLGEIGHLFP